jgi:hypothetical protein
LEIAIVEEEGEKDMRVIEGRGGATEGEFGRTECGSKVKSLYKD